MTIATDYLVVGAGALGMAFVDSLLSHSDADVVMVDRRHRPGGHWVDAYPFVQLHQPSRFYGVDSTSLGQDRLTADDGYERASGAEVCGYFDDVMRHRLLASGRVRFLPKTEYVGDRRVRSLLTGEITDVTVRTRVVDATYLASRVPATDPPPFAVAEGVRCVPVGELARLDEVPAGFVIVGGGKTAMDAVGWLLERGVDADAITWIRPGDAWLLNREFFQPGRAKTFEGVVLQLEAMVASQTVEEVYERLEAHGEVLRTDPAITPSMTTGATLSVAELEQLRRVQRVVRLGHVLHIEPHEIVLERGTIPTTPAHIHVHCASPGLSNSTPRPIFAGDVVTPQLVTRVGITLSGALVGYVEATRGTTEEKNRLCPPVALPHTPLGYLDAVLSGIRTEMSWSDAPDIAKWLDESRLNLLSGMDETEQARTQELQPRLFAALFPAFEKLDAFTADTPTAAAR